MIRGIESFPHAAIVAANFFRRRPVGRLVRRQVSSYGIDTEGKQPIDCGVKRLALAAQQIPLKSLQVPEVKNDAMALGNRAIIQSRGLDHRKQAIRLHPRGAPPWNDRVHGATLSFLKPGLL